MRFNLTFWPGTILAYSPLVGRVKFNLTFSEGMLKSARLNANHSHLDFYLGKKA